jgi:hypothetical protein
MPILAIPTTAIQEEELLAVVEILVTIIITIITTITRTMTDHQIITKAAAATTAKKKNFVNI